jgi:SAM-dependent methyltransferase
MGDSSFLHSHPGIYDTIGAQYARHRVPDARIAAQIHAALGDAGIVCNVGAGTGSYEPTDRAVIAVEPSSRMLAQRNRPAVRAVAEALPFASGAFDAAMAVLTVHHWRDIDAGLAEMCRVARRRVVLSFDWRRHSEFWLVRDYVPEIAELDLRAPSIERIASALGANRVEPVMIPFDCSDGFLAAYWRRPERYLDASVRACISGLAQLAPALVERGISKLRADLDSGRWHQRYAQLQSEHAMDWGYRLIISGADAR